MVALWYALACLMIVAYAVFDGFDFGCGLLHLIVARDDAERRQVFAAIGPVWDWNEVWILAAGGVLFVAFPKVIAVAFPGFYLALFLVLWCLIARGASIEVRSHLADPMWRAMWDAVFAGSSSVLALLFGVAIGNVVRGVPLDASGEFTMPFFTDLTARGRVGLLDWYTVSTGVFTVLFLGAHGAGFLAWKTRDAVRARSVVWRRRLWLASAVGLAVITAETQAVRPDLFVSMLGRPLAWLALAVAVGGAILVARAVRSGEERHDRGAFLGACALLAGIVSAAAAVQFPKFLHSTIDEAHALDAYDAASSSHGLATAIVWFPLGIALTVAYAVFIYRNHRGRVVVADEGGH